MKKFKIPVGNIMDVESVNQTMGQHLYNAIHQYNRMNYTSANGHIDRTTHCAESLLGPNDYKLTDYKADFRSQISLEVKAYYHKSDDRNKLI